MQGHRRQFLKSSLAASTLVAFGERTIPGFLDRTVQAAQQNLYKSDDTSGRKLVVIQLVGGNDGLNTVIPHRHDGYLRARRALRIASGQVHKLNDTLGLHPGLGGPAELFQQGRLAVIQGVGYPNPDRSHFRSMEIWESARLEANALDTGWLGRAVERQPGQTESPTPSSSSQHDVGAIYLGGGITPLALKTPRGSVSGFASLDALRLNTQGALREQLRASATRSPADPENPLAAFARQVTLSAYDATSRLESVTKFTSPLLKSRWGLERRLGQIAQIIKAGFRTPIYYTTLDGFDTHANQLGSHQALMNELGDSLASFDRELQSAKLGDRVAVLVFSEFGRRVEENASQGTDHGAAAPVFVAGPLKRAGVHGEHPSLSPSDLDDGDLVHHTDFRRIYAALLRDWLGIDPVSVLGAGFDPLPLFA